MFLSFLPPSSPFPSLRFCCAWLSRPGPLSPTSLNCFARSCAFSFFTPPPRPFSAPGFAIQSAWGFPHLLVLLLVSRSLPIASAIYAAFSSLFPTFSTCRLTPLSLAALLCFFFLLLCPSFFSLSCWCVFSFFVLRCSHFFSFVVARLFFNRVPGFPALRSLSLSSLAGLFPPYSIFLVTSFGRFLSVCSLRRRPSIVLLYFSFESRALLLHCRFSVAAVPLPGPLLPLPLLVLTFCAYLGVAPFYWPLSRVHPRAGYLFGAARLRVGFRFICLVVFLAAPSPLRLLPPASPGLTFLLYHMTFGSPSLFAFALHTVSLSLAVLLLFRSPWLTSSFFFTSRRFPCSISSSRSLPALLLVFILSFLLFDHVASLLGPILRLCSPFLSLAIFYR